MGLAVGDALGTTLEFCSPGSFEPIDDPAVFDACRYASGLILAATMGLSHEECSPNASVRETVAGDPAIWFRRSRRARAVRSCVVSLQRSVARPTPRSN